MEPLIMLSLSATHLILVVVALLLLFGGKKIPELMRGLGSGIKEFKDAVKEDEKPTTPQNNINNTTTNP